MEKTIIGALETIYLPSLSLAITARIDTGATTSSLHVDDYEIIQQEGKQWVRFSYHSLGQSSLGQNNHTVHEHCFPLLRIKKVISSNGKAEQRPVIETDIQLANQRWKIKLTLTNREQMKYPMLLGRQAMGNKFLINPAMTFLAKTC